MVFLVETHTAGFEDGMLLFFVNQVAAQASLFGNLPTDSAEEPKIISTKSPLVIFIDDLDRVSPENITIMLDAIKLITSFEKCIFVLGIDTNIVGASIESNYKDIVDIMNKRNDNFDSYFGDNFIEKIIQISFRIPSISEQGVKDYINSITSSNNNGNNNGTMNISKSISIKKDSFEFIESIKSTVGLLPQNPRKIKRFVNYFRLMVNIAEKRKLTDMISFELSKLATVIIAATEYNYIYKIFSSDENELWERLVRRANANNHMPKIDDGPSPSIHNRLLTRQESKIINALNSINEKHIYMKLSTLIENKNKS